MLAAAIPVLFLHVHYQPGLALGFGSTTIDAYLSDFAVLAVVVAAAVVVVAAAVVGAAVVSTGAVVSTTGTDVSATPLLESSPQAAARTATPAMTTASRRYRPNRLGVSDMSNPPVLSVRP